MVMIEQWIRRQNKVVSQQNNDHRFVAMFWSKVSVVKGFEKCWIWNGNKNEDGYGTFRFKDKTKRAHQVSYILFNGEYNKNKIIDHICRNRSCVNPEHLRLVTRRENAYENSENPFVKLASRTHCKNGHEFSGFNLKFRTDNNGVPCRRCRQCQKDSMKRHLEKVKAKTF